MTNHQRAILLAIDDWKSVPEIAAVTKRGGSTVRQRVAIRTTLEKMRDEYLVRFGAANATWRITDKGRAALAAALS